MYVALSMIPIRIPIIVQQPGGPSSCALDSPRSKLEGKPRWALPESDKVDDGRLLIRCSWFVRPASGQGDGVVWSRKLERMVSMYGKALSTSVLANQVN